MAKAIVIGAGFGGIAAALRLRRKGYDVTLIDKQDKLGGRAYQHERQTNLGTFIHDAGPTVITAKFLFDELFEMFGKKREDYVEFKDVYPWYRIVFAGAVTRSSVECDESHPTLPHFDYGGTLEQTLAEIRRFSPEDVDGYHKLLAHSKRIFDVGFTQLGDQPFHQFYTMLKCAPDMMRLGAWRTVYQMASKYIKDEKLRRVFSFQPLLVGGNPFNTTSIYSLIQYLEREWGVQFAMGGTGAIVRGLEKLMREEGIEIRLGEEVDHLQVKSIASEGQHRRMYADARQGVDSPERWRNHVAHVDGVTVRSRGDISADLVVFNADPPHVYRNLIGAEHRPKWKDKKIDALKYSMGLFVLYFGTSKTYPDVKHHTIVLGESYKELLHRMFDKHELERHDLSVYLHRPTATDPSMAPDGMESFYVLVPVPNLQPQPEKCGLKPTPRKDSPDASGCRLQSTLTPSDAEIPLNSEGAIDWARYGNTFQQHVVDYLERTVLPGLSACIVDPFYVTPEHFKTNLNTMHGTGFSVQPIFRQSAWFRFHNKSEDIDGLYFVGAGTHPGAGMPGVLCSAKVLEHLIPDAVA